MTRLTKMEEAVLFGMHITPNMWQDPERCPPSAEAVLDWCVEHGFLEATTGAKDVAEKLLCDIQRKIADPDGADNISLEDEATWILSKTFTKDQLLGMTDEEIVRWLQDWKYYFGFRKKEGWGGIYKYNAVAAIDGRLVLSDEDEDVVYVGRRDA